MTKQMSTVLTFLARSSPDAREERSLRDESLFVLRYVASPPPSAASSLQPAELPPPLFAAYFPCQAAHEGRPTLWRGRQKKLPDPYCLNRPTANFNQAEQDLSRTQIKAPFAGLVRAENVDIGQFVSRGNPIATIYAGNQAEVRLPIADRQLAFLNIPVSIRGEIPKEFQPKVTLTAQYAGQTLAWKGTIVRSEAEIDVSSRMVQLVARVESSSNPVPLSIGLFVSAEIEGLAANNIVVLPSEALRKGNQVLVVDKENILHFRKIDTLSLYQDDLLIKTGLKAGERVCVSPIQTVIEGMKVNPISIEA